MAVTLLPLSTGHYSLEFELSDMPAVAAAIRDRFGEPSKRRYLTYAEYSFGGSDFIFQNEWDDPCLIAGLDEGNAILRVLHETLVGT